MKHLGTVIIETERLILRRFTPEDVLPMYENWASDPEVTKYLTWPVHTSEEVTRMVIADWVSHYGEEKCYGWAIVPKALGQPIGSISVVHQNEHIQKAEIGYCIGKSWWHRGYMSEALAAVIRFLLEDVGFNRVEACHDPKNPHSGMVMAKCGMQYEGTQRSAGKNNQGICDLAWYAILAADRKEA